jgi:hypothetical protein
MGLTPNQTRTSKQRRMVIVLVSFSMLIGLPYVLWVGWYGSAHHNFRPRGGVAVFYGATLPIGFVVLQLVWRYSFNKGADDDKS